MSRAVIYLPSTLTRWALFDLEINPRGRSAGETITGAGQVVYGVKPRWEGRLRLILRHKADVLVWRAILSAMRGRINILEFPMTDPLRPRGTDMGLASADITVPHSDDSPFGDGAEYTQEASLPALGAAAMGATSLLVNGAYVANALQPGHHFSIDKWLYRVKTIDGSDVLTTITFEPPLRSTVSAGDELRLDAVAQWVFPQDVQSSAALERIVFSKPELSLIEHVNR